MIKSYLNLKSIALVAMFILQTTLCFAKQVSKEQSLKIAQQFYSQNVLKTDGNLKSASVLDFKLDYVSTDTKISLKSTSITSDTNESIAYYYIYNVGNNQGFVIVSGDDRTTPVLGYSNEGKFVYKNIPEHVKTFMDNYQEQIKNIMKRNDSTIVLKSTKIEENVKSVAPLIKTKWNQTSPYNSKIPIDATTGCVATAMAQVMNYHKWPNYGIGESGYFYPIIIVGKNEYDFYANFGKTKYDWGKMHLEYPPNADIKNDSCLAVATLMYHCGVSLQNEYKKNSSGAWVYDVPYALMNYFKYSQNVKYYSHEDFSDTEWKNLIISELDMNRPVILHGVRDSIGSHAFIGDGYDFNNLIHINWGWGGLSDGYFDISSLDSIPNNIYFNQVQGIVIGIQRQEKDYENSISFKDFAIEKTETLVNKDSLVQMLFRVIETNGESFNGESGIALFKEDSIITLLDSKQITIAKGSNWNTLYSNNGEILSLFAIKFPKTIQNGTYQIKPVYRTMEDTKWLPMRYEGFKGSVLKGNFEFTEVEVLESHIIYYPNSITMTCNHPGELSSKLHSPVTRLVISGKTNQYDIVHLNKVSKTIDMKNVDIFESSVCLNSVEIPIVTTGGEGLTIVKINERTIIRNSFSNRPIENIELPANLKHLESCVFSNCSNLNSIIIPDSIISLSDSLFYECKSLENITLSNELKTIGVRTFYGCKKLKSIELPSSVETIYEGAFDGCVGLKELRVYNLIPPVVKGAIMHNVSENITIHIPIGSKARYQSANGWKNITNLIDDLPITQKKTILNNTEGKLYTHFSDKEKLTINNLTITGNMNSSDFYFIRDSLLIIDFLDISEVKLPENKLPNSSFFNRKTDTTVPLSKILLPSSLTTIGDSAFYNCVNLEDVSLPNYLTHFGTSAFAGCTGIKEFKLNYGSLLYKIDEGVVYTLDGKSLVLYPAGRDANTYTVLSTTTTIEETAFCNCKNLNTIILPTFVSNIFNNAFSGCSSLTQINLVNKIPPILSGEIFFSGVSTDILIKVPYGSGDVYRSSIGWKDFTNINDDPIVKTVLNNVADKLSTQFSEGEKISVNKLIITGELNSTDVYFIRNNLSKLTELDISGIQITILTDYYFDHLSKITSFILPSGLKTISKKAFYYCSALTSLTIPSSVTSIGESAFERCCSLTSLTIPSSVTSIGESAFWGCSGLKSLTIPSSVTSIKSSTFYDCNSLTSIRIPSSVTSIGENAFDRCSSLTTLTIPSAVTSIGKYAFHMCSGLTSLIIPSSVTSIEESSFSGCKALTTLTIPSSVTLIGKNAFSGCSNLSSLTINSTVIGESAFSFCSGLTSLTILSSVTSIEKEAFYACVKLASLTIPLSIKSIGSDAFSSSGLKTLKVINPVPLDLSASSNVFSGLYNTCVLNVPVGSKNAYQNAVQWKDFKCIIEGEYSTSKAINVSVGSLSSALTSIEFISIKNLTVAGKIDARDFLFLRDSMPSLERLDLSGVEIVGYTGTGGPAGTSITTYASNAIPKFCFCSSSSLEGKTSLTSIKFPVSLTSIESCAFLFCTGLTGTLSIARSITSIGSSVFRGTNLSISVDINNTNYSSIDGVLFNKTQTELIYCPVSKQGEYIIPSSIKSFGFFAFDGCKDLTSIKIPSSITSIGKYAFYGSGITYIDIPSSVTSIGESAFENCKLNTISIPPSVISIGESAFENCNKLTSIYACFSAPVDLSSSLNVFKYVVKSNCILHVPVGCKYAFQTANQWKDFVNIIDDIVPLVITINIKDITLEATEGSTVTVEVTSNTTWSSSSNQTWLTINPIVETAGNGTLIFTATKNPTNNIRTATVTISANGAVSQIISVTQKEGEGTSIAVFSIENVKLYPNPATNCFYVEGINESAAKLVLSDLNGKVLFSSNIVEHENISVNSLPKGLYVVTIITAKGKIERKLVKE